MILHFYCVMCGKEKKVEIRKEGLDPGKTLRSVIEDQDWIAQFNSPHFDVYCSKRCAR